MCLLFFVVVYRLFPICLPHAADCLPHATCRMPRCLSAVVIGILVPCANERERALRITVVLLLLTLHPNADSTLAPTLSLCLPVQESPSLSLSLSYSFSRSFSFSFAAQNSCTAMRQINKQRRKQTSRKNNIQRFRTSHTVVRGMRDWQMRFNFAREKTTCHLF